MRRKPKATASSAVYGVPAPVVAGDTNGRIANGSGSCTQEPSAKPCGEVDLGRLHKIDIIKVTNRSDCCAERLHGLRLTRLDASRVLVFAGGKIRATELIEFLEK
ncbi:MAG: hypothetical protein ACPG3X_03495 [Opitutales bacterium]